MEGEIKLGSVEEIPYPDNYFDYIVSNGVIHHTLNTEKAVDEFYRVLKPGGLASVCIYYKNILLRQPFWAITKLLLPVIVKNKKGREKLFSAKIPEEFVRVYAVMIRQSAKCIVESKAMNCSSDSSILP